MRGRRRLRPLASRSELPNLARASDWPTAAQRTRPHPEARRKRRRYVVKRSAAIAATILRRAFHAQPVAARRTTRIQTLHGPTGQILHSFASQTHGPGDGRKSDAAEAPRQQKRQELAGLCAGGSSESRQIYTISSGAVAKLWKIRRAEERSACGRWHLLRRRFNWLAKGPADGVSGRWKAWPRVGPLSFARRPLPAAWPRPDLFRRRSRRRPLCRQRSRACRSRSANRD